MSSASPCILVVEDETRVRDLLIALLEKGGFEVLAGVDGPTALVLARTNEVQAVVLNLNLADGTGLEILEELKRIDPQQPVVVLATRCAGPKAVAAAGLGAFACLTGSLELDDLVPLLRRAVEMRLLGREVEALRTRLDKSDDLPRLMGSCESMRRVIEQVRQVAKSELTVLLQGETGVGKEVVAQAIHRHGDRAASPFVAIDCGAIPEALIESELFGHAKGAFTGAQSAQIGQFQQAQGGTLFLDEIGNMPLALQAKLLRILQEHSVTPVGSGVPVQLDLRVIVATNLDLRQEVGAGRFRQDLYFRMAECTIHIPPLRVRLEDIGMLAQRFIDEARSEMHRPVRGITAEAIEALRAHEWPGNVRELRNVIRLAVLHSNSMWIEPTHVQAALDWAGPAWPAGNDLIPAGISGLRAALPSASTAGLSLREIAAEAVERAERAAILAMLDATRGNKSEAARRLRTDYKTLHVKIRRYGLGGPRAASNGEHPGAAASGRVAPPGTNVARAKEG